MLKQNFNRFGLDLASSRGDSLSTLLYGSSRRLRRKTGAISKRGLGVGVVAYHHVEDAKDWRVKQMMELCNDYFLKLWSKGDVSLTDEILDPEFVHHDRIWRKKRLIVGPGPMKQFIIEMRKAYPDLYVEPIDFADGSIEHIFVEFEGWCTNLGKLRGMPPTGHYSTFSGVGIFRFNHDRSLIQEASIWRTPTKEDKAGGIDADDPFALHLARLHFD